MDDLDLRILRELQSSPQLSAEEISKRVGLSHTPCWRRIKRLEADGIIVERAIILNAEKLNLGLTVFASVKLKQHEPATLEAIENAARNCPEIVESFSMTGDCDYIFRILIRDVPAYEKFLKGTLLKFPGVASINSSVALKQVKLTTKVPL
jgi:Lrp/AsnC family transcriptional regulator